MNNTRLSRLTSDLSRYGLDAIAINPGPTLVYLTGLHFHLMERPTVLLVVPGKKPVMVLPELEMGKARVAQDQIDLVPYGENPAGWPEIFKQACQSLGLANQTIGVEPNQFRFLELNLLQMALPAAHFASAEAAMSGLRMLKDPQEVAAMRKAVEIAQAAFENTLPMIRVGVTEREIASELTIQLLRAGSASDMPFAPIIASGPNSANGHAVPTDRQIQPGDLIVVDWGATYNGYISDLTRTLAFHPLDPELARIAEVVLAANRAGCAAARQGVTAGSVDQSARKVIEDSGYGKYFVHRTGHGIGMEGHEPPYIFGENDLVLKPGMAFTVEPGIYLPGRGGVRVEDNVVISETGADVLSDLPRELVFLG